MVGIVTKRDVEKFIKYLETRTAFSVIEISRVEYQLEEYLKQEPRLVTDPPYEDPLLDQIRKDDLIEHFDEEREKFKKYIDEKIQEALKRNQEVPFTPFTESGERRRLSWNEYYCPKCSNILKYGEPCICEYGAGKYWCGNGNPDWTARLDEMPQYGVGDKV